MFNWVWPKYSDLTRVFTPNGGLVMEIPLFQGFPQVGEILFHLARLGEMKSWQS